MKTSLSLVGVMVLAVGFAGCSRPQGNPSEAAAMTLIQKLGGKFELDATRPDQPIVKVYLHNTAVRDADLGGLKSLTRLQNLFLGQTKLTDAALEQLRGFNQLQTLSLNGTAVTDAGLPQLGGLTNLKTLNLQETRVTTAGIADLKRKLPGLTIAH